jgi:putative tricarboxylic transport membrane protein
MSREEGSSLVWLGLAIVSCIGSLRLSFGSLQNPGPGFLPFIAGLIMGVLAAIVYFQARRVAVSAKETRTPLWTNLDGLKKVVITTLALLVYGVGMNYLGFLISTFIFLVFLLRTIEPQRWGLVILEALLSSGVAYFVFEIWLHAQLPKGVFQI